MRPYWPKVAGADGTRLPTHSTAAICVVAASDGVTGSSFVASWRRLPTVRVHGTTKEVHGNLQALSICDGVL